MNKKIILDTNIILRFILDDVHKQYIEAEELIKKAKNKKILIIIPEVVIFEVAFTLSSYYEQPKATVLNVLKSLISSDYFEVENKQIFLNTLKIYENTNLQLVDCFLAAKSKFLEAQLYTFDNNLKKYLSK